jgi:hypothetical protein
VGLKENFFAQRMAIVVADQTENGEQREFHELVFGGTAASVKHCHGDATRANGKSTTSAITPADSVASNHQELGIANSRGYSEDASRVSQRGLLPLISLARFLRYEQQSLSPTSALLRQTVLRSWQDFQKLRSSRESFV